MQASSRSRSGRRYPRHGPLVGEATEEGSYTLRCLACGVKGPEREDTLKAKLAFDETFVANDCYSPTFREVEFSEVGHAFCAKSLMNSAVGQPLGKQFLRPLGPRGRFIS